jgi:DNA invertase Pin-like site-specific DNA recombinase
VAPSAAGSPGTSSAGPKEGKPHGRPITAGLHLQKVKELFRKGLSKREIAKQIGISRTSVRRLLAPV